eukprot:2027348-Pyramimonas_sp.AAC.1
MHVTLRHRIRFACPIHPSMHAYHHSPTESLRGSGIDGVIVPARRLCVGAVRVAMGAAARVGPCGSPTAARVGPC